MNVRTKNVVRESRKGRNEKEKLSNKSILKTSIIEKANESNLIGLTSKPSALCTRFSSRS